MSSELNKKSDRDPVQLGPMIDRLLAGFGLAQQLGGWRIVAGWPEIAGEKIARVSRAIRFSDDTLLISVPDAGWRQELSLQTDRILDKIHAVPGGRAVRRIHFVS
jgi:predicted nucleic acid-binding Zn ribbon protein